MPSCYNCGSPIAGDICTKCGWDTTEMSEQPLQQTQQYTQHYQYPKPRYPGSQKRSRAPYIFGLIVIQAIILLASISFSEIVPDKEDEIMEMTLREFMEDYEDSDGDGNIDNLRSLNFKDKVRISDVVAKTHFINWEQDTIIICESTKYLEWSFPIFFQFRADNVEEGDPIMIIWHISKFNIEGIVMELPLALYSYYISQEDLFINTSNPEGKLDKIPYPVGKFRFREVDPQEFSGGLSSLKYPFKLRDCSITIIDASDGSSSSHGPPIMSKGTITTSGGLSLQFENTKRDGELKSYEDWIISNGEKGDQIKLIHKTGRTIANYTIP